MGARQSGKALQAGAFFFALLVPAIGAAGPCAARHLDAAATVARVYDGDTVRLEDGRHVRLVGLDTPEIGHGGAPSEPYAEEARAALLRLAGPGTRLRLEYGRERRDRYGRTLAHLFLPGGENLQRRILEQGLATTLVVPPNVAHASCYAAAEARARRGGRGLWSLPRYQPIDAARLPAGARGFRILHGRVSRVGRSAGALWLQLAPQVALRIPRGDLRYFDAYDPAQLLGRRVQARGWVYRRGGELRMEVRHPAALQVLQ